MCIAREVPFGSRIFNQLNVCPYILTILVKIIIICNYCKRILNLNITNYNMNNLCVKLERLIPTAF